METNASSAHRWGVILALVAAFGFSLKAIFVKLGYGYQVSPVVLLALRMGFALPVFLWVGLHAGRQAAPLTGRDWLRLTLLGSAGYYGASILDFMGLQYITAGLERLILFTYPTLTVLAGVLFQGKRLTRNIVAAIGLSYLGIGFAFFHDVHLAGDLGPVLIGGGLVFASSLSYAFYLAGSGSMIARLGSARFTALAMLMSTAGTLLHFVLTEPFSAFVQPLPVYGLGLAMALVCTVMPVFAQSAAIRRIGAGPASLMGTVGPLLTIVFGWWWLGEHISAAQIFGGGLVILGVWLVGRGGGAKTKQV
ncbi:MAG: DMT family transporter [Rhodocyclaceae bacterium]|nr:DMT family transporter [Rhodocyclaceae bacterium]